MRARFSRRFRAIPERTAVNVQWLIRLRWAQIVGQAATIIAAHVGLDLPLPLIPLAIVVGIGLLSNLALELFVFGSLRVDRAVMRSTSEWQLAGLMALDVALLTVLLALTGGPLNPFGFLYLVQIALATVLLRAAWAWTLVALSFTGYGVMLALNLPLPISDGTRMVGMWVALGVAAAFIVHFLLRITSALAERDNELDQARNLAARRERLASLATMAAGAAHELSTPLSTVALVAKELERHLSTANAEAHLIDDARLIRDQVGRCRGILDQMAGGAGTLGEGIDDLSVEALLADSLIDIREAPAVHLHVPEEVRVTVVRLPPRAISQVLRSLITNAQDASGPDHDIDVSARLQQDDRGPSLRITIVDQGPGMTPDVLARVGEPFYTTKSPGRGMGLGLYLARAVVEGVGGTMIIDSTPGMGTRIVVAVPVKIGAANANFRQAPTGRANA